MFLSHQKTIKIFAKDAVKITELDLLICEPIYYTPIDSENIASDCHEDWEPSKELEKRIDEFNAYLKTLPAHSYAPGKIRTIYKLTNS